MYVPETTHSGYIGMPQEHQIPMYPKKEYIGTLQLMAIPMYHLLQTYQIKQPALPHTSNSKRISARIIAKYIGTPQKQAILMYLTLKNTPDLSKYIQIHQIKQPAMPLSPNSGHISAQVITGSTVFRGLYTDSRKRMKASRPSGVHLYTPASSSTCRNTLPVSSLMMSIALSALNSGWFGRNSSTQSA